MNLIETDTGEVKNDDFPSRSESEAEQAVYSADVNAKPRDQHKTRMKSR